jgi:hypothetical protein
VTGLRLRRGAVDIVRLVRMLGAEAAATIGTWGGIGAGASCMPIFSLLFSAAMAFFLRRYMNKMPASKAATPTKIPRARPALAPPDMPSLSEASDVGVAEMEAVAEAVADTSAPTSEPE